ncbi:unnamed protein product [Ilex paraguariensis]|uniref:EF-hand domain-containing protein n=1 Tax=Ilex paraguariensis TaxID=185542 RepID=A0ABC8QV21_9AQUA
MKTPTKNTTFLLSSLFKILHWDMISIHNFLSSVHFFLQNLLKIVLTKCNLWNSMKAPNHEPLSKQSLSDDEEFSEEKLCREEVNMVMDRLGITCDFDGESFGVNELSWLFDHDEELGLEELKEAFDVFDENKDGFIEATELQRVLCNLGFKEGSELEECTRMIKAFDGSGDGLIDVSEFVKFMEKGFC